MPLIDGRMREKERNGMKNREIEEDAGLECQMGGTGPGSRYGDPWPGRVVPGSGTGFGLVHSGGPDPVPFAEKSRSVSPIPGDTDLARFSINSEKFPKIP